MQGNCCKKKGAKGKKGKKKKKAERFMILAIHF